MAAVDWQQIGRDPATFFYALPADLTLLVRHYTVPAVAVPCRDAVGDEWIVYQPLDGMQSQWRRHIAPYTQCYYGVPVSTEWRRDSVVVGRRVVGHRGTSVVQCNYSAATPCTDPAWSADLPVPASDGPTIQLPNERVMLSCEDSAFWICDTARRQRAMPSGLQFGVRDPVFGAATLAACDLGVPHVSLIAGTRRQMALFCAETLQTFRRVLPDGEDRVTCMLSQPQSSNYLVGMGNRLHLYDFRASDQPSLSAQAAYPLWRSAAMISEHALVSWNSLMLRADGSWLIGQHCQSCDLRSPREWTQAAHWNLPAGFMPLWATAVENTPVPVN